MGFISIFIYKSILLRRVGVDELANSIKIWPVIWIELQAHLNQTLQ